MSSDIQSTESFDSNDHLFQTNISKVDLQKNILLDTIESFKCFHFSKEIGEGEGEGEGESFIMPTTLDSIDNLEILGQFESPDNKLADRYIQYSTLSLRLDSSTSKQENNPSKRILKSEM
jgi:hypothetical protein